MNKKSNKRSKQSLHADSIQSSIHYMDDRGSPSQYDSIQMRIDEQSAGDLLFLKPNEM